MISNTMMLVGFSVLLSFWATLKMQTEQLIV